MGALGSKLDAAKLKFNTKSPTQSLIVVLSDPDLHASLAAFIGKGNKNYDNFKFLNEEYGYREAFDAFLKLQSNAARAKAICDKYIGDEARRQIQIPQGIAADLKNKCDAEDFEPTKNFFKAAKDDVQLVLGGRTLKKWVESPGVSELLQKYATKLDAFYGAIFKKNEDAVGVMACVAVRSLRLSWVDPV
jgi:hypothetical protein